VQGFIFLFSNADFINITLISAHLFVGLIHSKKLKTTTLKLGKSATVC
jgi:hypothetical protein